MGKAQGRGGEGREGKGGEGGCTMLKHADVYTWPQLFKERTISLSNG